MRRSFNHEAIGHAPNLPGKPSGSSRQKPVDPDAKASEFYTRQTENLDRDKALLHKREALEEAEMDKELRKQANIRDASDAVRAKLEEETRLFIRPRAEGG